MANQQQLQILLRSCQKNNTHQEWNLWRKKNPNEIIDLSSVNLQGLDLSFANLKNVSFQNCYLKHAIFYSAKLQNSSFNNSYLLGASFEKANLKKAQLENVCLLQGIMRSTNLQRTNFLNADLRYCNFNDAFFSNTNMEKTTIDGIFIDKNIGSINIKTIINCSHFIWCDCNIQIKNQDHLNLMRKCLTKEKKWPSLFSYSPQKEKQRKISNGKKAQKTSQKKEHQKSILIKKKFTIPEKVKSTPEKVTLLKSKNTSTSTSTNKWKYLFVGIIIIISSSTIIFKQHIQIYLLIHRLQSKNIKIRRETISNLKMASRTIQTHPLIIKTLITRLDDKDQEIKKKIIKILNMINKPAIKPLIRVLYFGSQEQKISALKVISNMYTQGMPALNAILELLQGTDKELQREATKTIYKIGHSASKSLPILIRNMTTKDALLKIETLKTIRKMPLNSMASFWVQKNLNSNHDEVFRTTIISMSSWNNISQEIVPILHQRLQETKNINLQKSILFVLRRIAKHVEVKEVIPTLIKYMHGSYFPLAFEAMNVISSAKYTSVIKKMLKSKNEQSRKLAAMGFLRLEKQDKKNIINTFIQAIKTEKNEYILLTLLSATKSIGLIPELIHQLKDMSTSKNQNIKNASIATLGHIDNSQELIDWLTHKMIHEKNIAAQQGLANIGKKVLPNLQKIWTQKNDKYTKKSILATLKKMKQKAKPSLEWILPSFKKSQPKIRIMILEILAFVQQKNTTPHEIIMKGLVDNSSLVRKKTTEIIVTLRVKRTKKIILLLLDNLNLSNENLRFSTIKTLIYFRHLNKPFLNKTLQDKNPRIRGIMNKVIQAIQKRKDKK